MAKALVCGGTISVEIIHEVIGSIGQGDGGFDRHPTASLGVTHDGHECGLGFRPAAIAALVLAFGVSGFIESWHFPGPLQLN
jgi:hypothetical protein